MNLQALLEGTEPFGFKGSLDRLAGRIPTGAADAWPVGSRVSCNPPPTDTDEDWLVFTKDRQFKLALLAAGFTTGEDPDKESGGSSFNSYRKGDLNIIVSPNRWFVERFLVATALATRFNLMDKADRIALFQGVLYGRLEDPNA